MQIMLFFNFSLNRFLLKIIKILKSRNRFNVTARFCSTISKEKSTIIKIEIFLQNTLQFFFIRTNFLFLYMASLKKRGDKML